jgi:hypothetical protein
MAGGFSLHVWTDAPMAMRGRGGLRVAIKTLDSKRALKKYRRLEREAQDFAGHLLDLRTLVFVDRGQSHPRHGLRSVRCCRKADTPEFGRISVEAIDYCREDVAATIRLYQAVMAEYRKHRSGRQPTSFPGIDRQGRPESVRHPAPARPAARVFTGTPRCGDERLLRRPVRN